MAWLAFRDPLIHLRKNGLRIQPGGVRALKGRDVIAWPGFIGLTLDGRPWIKGLHLKTPGVIACYAEYEAGVLQASASFSLSRCIIGNTPCFRSA